MIEMEIKKQILRKELSRKVENNKETLHTFKCLINYSQTKRDETKMKIMLLCYAEPHTLKTLEKKIGVGKSSLSAQTIEMRAERILIPTPSGLIVRKEDAVLTYLKLKISEVMFFAQARAGKKNLVKKLIEHEHFEYFIKKMLLNTPTPYLVNLISGDMSFCRLCLQLYNLSKGFSTVNELAEKIKLPEVADKKIIKFIDDNLEWFETCKKAHPVEYVSALGILLASHQAP